uniref:Caspase-1 n=1 Tax=Neogobius melanostomus TaxID=47308 RepID=A0A8C6SMF4_9GOBI
MPPKNPRVTIRDALKNLEESNFRDFCDELAKPEGKPRIWPSDVEKKSRTEVMKVLVSRCSSGAVDRAITTLRDIGCNDEADELGEMDLHSCHSSQRCATRIFPAQTWARPLITTLCMDKLKHRLLPVAPNSKRTKLKHKSIKNRVALLITNNTFTELKNRPGAEKDEENMKELLSTLGYEVVKHTNLTAKKMENALDDFSKHPKLKETDSVFVVISSHGKLGAVLGVNHKPDEPDELKVDDIHDKLNVKSCPALVNKPKIIIIQACRGKETGSALVEADDVAVREIDEDVLRYTHKEKDFIALLSSTPHTVSYRHSLRGSFLIRFTVDVFEANLLKDHIEDLFRKVMKRFEEGKELPDCRQMATKDRCTLTHHFFLFPGDLKQ